MSLTTIRPNVVENGRSISASAGRMTSFTRAEPGHFRLVVVFDRARHPKDIAGGNLIAFPSKFVTAVRSANTLEDSVAHERLQHRFEMAWPSLLRAARI